MSNSGYVEYVLDALFSLGQIRARKMFGGYGIYKDNVCFALILYDVLYFKVQDADKSLYEAHGSVPFSYEKNGKRIAMSYWQVPADILEDSDQLAEWVEKALFAAKCAKKVRRPSPK